MCRLGSYLAPILGLAILGLSLSVPVEAGTQDEELKAMKEALATSTNRNRNFTLQLENLDDDIRALKGKLVVAAKVITSLDNNLIRVEKRLEEIRQVEDDTLQDLAKRNKELASTLSALVNLSRQPEGTIIGNPAGLVDSLRASSLLQSIIPKLKKDADQLSRQLSALEELRSQYATEQEQFAALRDQRTLEQKELDLLMAAKHAAQEKIATASSTEKGRLNILTTNVRDMTALMKRLEVDKKKQQAAERKKLEQDIATRQARQKQLESSEKSAAAVPPPASEKNPKTEPENTAAEAQLASVNIARQFLEAKGTLPLPVGGRIISNYNEPKKTGQQKGIVIESRSAAAVISPYDGKIAFAGPFRHYGLLLIIDHGDGFHTLLSGMGSIDGSVGQLLLAGEPVGRMENSGNEKPKLYMELRSKGAPINPIPWLLAENRKVSG